MRCLDYPVKLQIKAPAISFASMFWTSSECNKAIEVSPQYAEAYNNRCTAKRSLKDYDGAVADYDQAIEINPQYTEAISNRADVQAIKK